MSCLNLLAWVLQEFLGHQERFGPLDPLGTLEPLGFPKPLEPLEPVEIRISGAPGLPGPRGSRSCMGTRRFRGSSLQGTVVQRLHGIQGRGFWGPRGLGSSWGFRGRGGPRLFKGSRGPSLSRGTLGRRGSRRDLGASFGGGAPRACMSPRAHGPSKTPDRLIWEGVFTADNGGIALMIGKLLQYRWDLKKGPSSGVE